MNSEKRTEVPVEPGLSRTAASQLAGDFIATLDDILANAAALEGRTTDAAMRSLAAEIRRAASRLRDVCEDTRDALAPAEPGIAALDVAGIAENTGAILRGRNLRVRLVESTQTVPTVQTTHRRAVAHVVEHVARMATTDLTIASASRADGRLLIALSPLPEGLVPADDGVVALATRLLAAGGGEIGASGRRLELLVPLAATAGRTHRPLLEAFDRLRIDHQARTVDVDGRHVALTPREFDLFAFLASSPGRVYSRGELLEEVWSSAESWQDPATVTEHVRRIRAKIDPDGRRPELIRAVRGIGYSFEP